MALWFLILLPFLFIKESESAHPINQTDLQLAIDDMRASSYYGFVILLKILDSTPNSLHDGEITFLMPSDKELSKVSLRLDYLEDFIQSHSIPRALLLSHLLHFPDGTLVPSSIPNRLLRISNGGRSGLYVNNARVVTPNVCLNSLIRCHGISTAMTFDSVNSSFVKQGKDDDQRQGKDNQRPADSGKHHKKGKSLPVHFLKSPAPQ
ncbi:hypothetical protein JCGZ_18475 [Jatropha curcas]|uniref:FAS1 domain-containing protein n=1 Tax=Jatropha curcas TaxID=180498 RepID=A0A067K0Z9_JATCU|nr:uncharacterized protein LOC105641547 [Jatropha curcas]KDP29906.1 hypothetical protein JCGZ_18475 [Jatropha curcas]